MNSLVSDIRFHLFTRARWISQLAELDLTDLWVKGIKLVLSFLIVTILFALTGACSKRFSIFGSC
jgi:hypothetical protein